MDLKQAIKSVNILNIDWDESTASKDTFLLNEDDDSSFIVSDADEEILILIEFSEEVDLHNIIFTALPLEDNIYTSPPKEILLYKATNVCVNFDDMSSHSADKVIEGKAKKLSKGQKVSLRKKLTFRQIKYLIIYVRANQNDSEKTHLHKIKINGICDAKLNNEKKLNLFDESKYIQRIDELFIKQESNEMSDEALNDYVYKKYGDNVSKFLDDYHKFIKNLHSNRLYLRQRNAVCSKNNCVFLKRRRRYQRSENGNKKGMIGQRLRQIHILSHQYDDQQRFKNDKNYRQQIVRMKTECDEKEPQSNKFVTDIKASSESLMNGKYLKYLRGFKFYYHSFYKDKDTPALGKEYEYETMMNYDKSTANKPRTFKIWYITAKYKDLKEEVVGGGHLTLEQFENEFSKAEVNICSIEARKLVANSRFEQRYNVRKYSAITVKQMLCVMLYTNYDALQNKLSKTFRKISEAETDEQLRRRHAAFVHLSKFITEAIWCFGNNDLNVNVYHGANAPAIFDNFTVSFCGPTSTTTSKSIAINFATNGGTVINIQGFKGHTVSNHFDCELWSDYPWEQEKLFIGMDVAMPIINVHDIGNDIEYAEWIDVIRVFSHLLRYALYLVSPISRFVEENVRLLLDSVKNESANCIPQYIVDTFNNIRMDTKYLRIHLNLLSKDIYWIHKTSGWILYGGKRLKNIYFDQNENIKWTFINLLFPKLRRAHILSYVPDERNIGTYSYSNTILLTDDVLNDILQFLMVSNIEEFLIFSPQNNEYSLERLKTKFSAKYKGIGYDLNIGQSERQPRNLNQCLVFQIEKVNGN